MRSVIAASRAAAMASGLGCGGAVGVGALVVGAAAVVGAFTGVVGGAGAGAGAGADGMGVDSTKGGVAGGTRDGSRFSGCCDVAGGGGRAAFPDRSGPRLSAWAAASRRVISFCTDASALW